MELVRHPYCQSPCCYEWMKGAEASMMLVTYRPDHKLRDGIEMSIVFRIRAASQCHPQRPLLIPTEDVDAHVLSKVGYIALRPGLSKVSDSTSSWPNMFRLHLAHQTYRTVALNVIREILATHSNC